MTGLAGECFPVACLGLAGQQWGFHSHCAYHTVVLMALTIASGVLAQLVSPLPQGLLPGLSCLFGPTLGHHICLKHHTELICPASVPIQCQQTHGL